MGEWKTIEPDMWKPTIEGDVVEGILLQKVPRDTLLSARYTIQLSDGKLKLVWGTTVLDNRMQLVKVGDRVKITYKGETLNSKRQKLKLYKVEVFQGDEIVDDEII